MIEFKRKKIYFTMAIILIIIFSATNVVFAFILKRILDSVAQYEHNIFFNSVMLAIIIIILELIVSITGRFFALLYVVGESSQAKSLLFTNILRGFTIDKLPDIAMFSSNIDLLYNSYYMNKILMVYYISQCTMSIIALVYLNWLLCIISLIISMLPLLVPILMKKRLAKTIEAYSNEASQYMSFLKDSFDGLADIKAFHAQEPFIASHSEHNTELERKRLVNKVLTYSANRISTFLSSGAFITTIGVSGFFVITKQLSIGSMLAVIQILNSMVTPIVQAINAWTEIKSTQSLHKKYYENKAIKLNNKIEIVGTGIHIKELNFAYKENTEILKEFSYDFHVGKKYAIIGESGCGKSTLAKLIAGIERNYSGQIKIGTSDVSNVDPDDLSKLIIYIKQDAHIFNMNLFDNITMRINTKQTSDIKNIYSVCRLNEFAVEDNENTLSLGGASTAISAGEKQRIIIARALYARPEILILDETTSNMNADLAFELMRDLCAIYDKTLIMITHSMDSRFLELFDEVVKLNGASEFCVAGV